MSWDDSPCSKVVVILSPKMAAAARRSLVWISHGDRVRTSTVIRGGGPAQTVQESGDRRSDEGLDLDPGAGFYSVCDMTRLTTAHVDAVAVTTTAPSRRHALRKGKVENVASHAV